ncbi:hypothetical protein [Paraburkholderia dilworthii]|uniref:hypothetical protein n=1 Tax=Paraburkholderia dilworthii TaxID=948106 RepID=UPI000481449F|nr:hypothetical protein [Paraburkholderia dilworthii]
MEQVHVELRHENRAAHHGDIFVPRDFKHPGQVARERIVEARSSQETREILVYVPSGQNVGEAIERVLEKQAPQGSGCGQIPSGGFSEAQYHVMTKARTGIKPYVYGPPVVVYGQSTLITSSINVGRLANDSRILHCHGGFVDECGVQHGGHIILSKCVASSAGLTVRLSMFADVNLVVSADIETTFELLQPVVRK